MAGRRRLDARPLPSCHALAWCSAAAERSAGRRQPGRRSPAAVHDHQHRVETSGFGAAPERRARLPARARIDAALRRAPPLPGAGTGRRPLQSADLCRDRVRRVSRRGCVRASVCDRVAQRPDAGGGRVPRHRRGARHRDAAPTGRGGADGRRALDRARHSRRLAGWRESAATAQPLGRAARAQRNARTRTRRARAAGGDWPNGCASRASCTMSWRTR